MKKGTLIFTFSLIIIFSTSFNSCQKFDKNEDKDIMTEQEIALRDASFSPEFSWESTRIITLNISSTDSQILNITSIDKTIRYYKGIHTNNSKTYVIKLSVPIHVEKLRINDQELSLDSDKISINL